MLLGRVGGRSGSCFHVFRFEQRHPCDINHSRIRKYVRLIESDVVGHRFAQRHGTVFAFIVAASCTVAKESARYSEGAEATEGRKLSKFLELTQYFE